MVESGSFIWFQKKSARQTYILIQNWSWIFICFLCSNNYRACCRPDPKSTIWNWDQGRVERLFMSAYVDNKCLQLLPQTRRRWWPSARSLNVRQTTCASWPASELLTTRSRRKCLYRKHSCSMNWRNTNMSPHSTWHVVWREVVDSAEVRRHCVLVG